MRGFEIGSHTVTHPFLTSLSEEEMKEELEGSKRRLEERYKINVETIAFPYWDYDERVLSISKRFYITARSIYNGDPNAFFLDSFGVTKTHKPEEICEIIKQAKDNNLWLILVFHDISLGPGGWDSSIGDFKKILDCAQDIDIKTKSMRDCKKLLQ
jgi:peptidoglycan/xylan/chitin deacetylase (PgdA/CDA1 family)